MVIDGVIREVSLVRSPGFEALVARKIEAANQPHLRRDD
jgi:hypothetical protein